MKYIFIIVNIVNFVFCLTSCQGQNKYHSEYNIGTVPNRERFEKLTEREIYIDTLLDKYNTEKLQRMMDGTAFIAGVSEEDKQKSIEYQKTISQRYRDNRSRYYLERIINDREHINYFEDVDTLTSGCDCYLSEDIIRIKMGIGFWGGFAFIINLSKNKFESGYWEDSHKQYIYKTNLTDTILVDNVFVENAEQSLVLENRPSFSIGENLSGYLTFKTKDYYKTNDDKEEKMDTLNMAGSLYFKCKVRKKTIGDE